ncbi:sulfite exporter TauE/SafE family protein [Sphingobacterium daejeonense]|uniref:sulfite exporter TauE/SafE family protein n=1 Tax=Sphingobacterium daejeonense TaxID=371142 RepID=UPI0021D02DCB|nr:sulfite exporter TauE/SafE family protein [Sphingobacterium daejeonense]
MSGLVWRWWRLFNYSCLDYFNHMSMRNAVGTSLVIIACNSLFGFIGNLDLQLIDWHFLLTISVIAIVGILIGARMSQKIDGKKLKPAFGWFVLIMGLVVIMQELIK